MDLVLHFMYMMKFKQITEFLNKINFQFKNWGLILLFFLSTTEVLASSSLELWISKNARCETSFQSKNVVPGREGFRVVDEDTRQTVDFYYEYKSTVLPILKEKGLNPKDQIFLGYGSFGGVYLINVNSKLFVWKHFPDGEGLKNDLESFDFLRVLKEKYNLKVNIPQSFRLDYENLLLEYVAGDSLHNIYKSKDSKESESTQRHVKALAEEMYLEISKALSNYPLRGPHMGDPRGKNFITLPGRKSTRLFLHEKNVIYDPAREEFWIIDPF